MNLPDHNVYEGAEYGPFRCGHCTHFTAPNVCHHPYIIKLRRGIVEAGGCCDFYAARIGHGLTLSGLTNSKLRRTL